MIKQNSMLQAVMVKPGEILFQETDIPTPGPSQVLIKIMKIGICGSDIHVFHGTHPYTKYPVTQGHEVSGKIVAVGDNVLKMKVGQKVTVEPQVYCGKCYPCRHGKYNLCENLKVMGFQTTGLASEFFAVDVEKVTLIPDTMSYSEGAMIEPLAVTIHAAKRFSDVINSNAVVIGCGPIGCLLIQSLKALGATSVLATDISEYRLSLARKLGADYVANTSNASFEEAIVNAFGMDKADVIFDCAGNDISIDQAIQSARKGSTIVLVAVFAKKAYSDLAKLNDSELDLNSSMMYRHEDYLDAIRFVEEGKVKLEPMMSKHFSFKDYLEAYKYIDENRETTMKVIIDVNPSED